MRLSGFFFLFFMSQAGLKFALWLRMTLNPEPPTFPSRVLGLWVKRAQLVFHRVRDGTQTCERDTRALPTEPPQPSEMASALSGASVPCLVGGGARRITPLLTVLQQMAKPQTRRHRVA